MKVYASVIQYGYEAVMIDGLASDCAFNEIDKFGLCCWNYRVFDNGFKVFYYIYISE